MERIKKFFKMLGPGIITGAADDDPSGIATFSQAGAQFGLNLVWSALYLLPFLIVVQGACAKFGAKTGEGIAALIKKNYSKIILYPIITSLLIANIINIGANISAMAEAAYLIIPIPQILWAFIFTITMILLEVFVYYRTYANILKWLCVSLLSYWITVFLVQENWLETLKATFIPHFEIHFEFLFILTSIIGTTISPYLFFWQASQVVEEKKEKHLKKDHKKSSPKNLKLFLNRIQWDNWIGMFFSEVTTWTIIVVGANVLHPNGIMDIKTSAEAAKALAPLVKTFPNSGFVAEIIFAMGIIGLGLISVPVLAGSAAYAIGETFDFKIGLNLKLRQGPFFYAVIIFSMIIGFVMNFLRTNPFKALIFSAFINGLISIPLLFLIILQLRNKNILGKYRIHIGSYFLILLLFFVLIFASSATIWSFIFIK